MQSTPIRSFVVKDPTIPPPTPSPTKSMQLAIAQTPSRPVSSAKTPAKPAKQGSRGPMILATQSGPNIVAQPPSLLRQQVTEVKEFKFATESRTRRVPTRENTGPMKTRNESSTMASRGDAGPKSSITDHKTNVQNEGEMMRENVDEGLALRMKAYEMGKASILAWGETRGRYLDE